MGIIPPLMWLPNTCLSSTKRNRRNGCSLIEITVIHGRVTDRQFCTISARDHPMDALCRVCSSSADLFAVTAALLPPPTPLVHWLAEISPAKTLTSRIYIIGMCTVDIERCAAPYRVRRSRPKPNAPPPIAALPRAPPRLEKPREQRAPPVARQRRKRRFGQGHAAEGRPLRAHKEAKRGRRL